MGERLGVLDTIKANLGRKLWDLFFADSVYSHEGTLIEDPKDLSLEQIRQILGVDEDKKSVGNGGSTS